MTKQEAKLLVKTLQDRVKELKKKGAEPHSKDLKVVVEGFEKITKELKKYRKQLKKKEKAFEKKIRKENKAAEKRIKKEQKKDKDLATGITGKNRY